jgi:hypothetical protein
MRKRCHVGNDLRFTPAKTVLALDFENCRQLYTGTRLDFMIRIDEDIA